jgi:L-threonylcarbamoyladenylate synthase
LIVSAQKAAELIQSGHVVALPTETVYGLAADASNVLAVRKIFELKRRPADNPLIVHVADVAQISAFSDVSSDILTRLTERFWPGLLALVLPKKPTAMDVITAGLNTVALRMPNHSTTLSIIMKAGPVAAPSANRSGRPSPTRPEHVSDDFGKNLPVVDGGPCSIGLESTVLDLSGETLTILRPGKITAEEIEDLLGRKVLRESSDRDQSKRSPGTRYSHYKPHAEVQWLESLPLSFHQTNCLYIYHTQNPDSDSDNIICFNGNFEGLARSLYDLYRTADKKKYQKIIIEPLPDTSLSPLIPAIVNRIQRSVSQ